MAALRVTSLYSTYLVCSLRMRSKSKMKFLAENFGAKGERERGCSTYFSGVLLRGVLLQFGRLPPPAAGVAAAAAVALSEKR